MITLAIDPGSSESAYVLYGDSVIHDFEKRTNEDLIALLRDGAFDTATDLAIEMAQSFGAKVWDQVFVTTRWVGRFVEAWDNATGCPHHFVYRRDVKLFVTGSPQAKDGQIRQCLIERWGGKDKAIGKKNTPGPLYGISADVWAALAVAVTFTERKDAA